MMKLLVIFCVVGATFAVNFRRDFKNLPRWQNARFVQHLKSVGSDLSTEEECMPMDPTVILEHLQEILTEDGIALPTEPGLLLENAKELIEVVMENLPEGFADIAKRFASLPPPKAQLLTDIVKELMDLASRLPLPHFRQQDPCMGATGLLALGCQIADKILMLGGALVDAGIITAPAKPPMQGMLPASVLDELLKLAAGTLELKALLNMRPNGHQQIVEDLVTLDLTEEQLGTLMEELETVAESNLEMPSMASPSESRSLSNHKRRSFRIKMWHRA